MNQPCHPKKRPAHSLRGLAWSFVCLLAAGCAMLKPAPNTTRFYILSTTDTTETAIPGTTSQGPRCVVRVRPIDLAAYLKIKEIAVRTNRNQIDFSLTHQWAEPLDEGIRRVLAENLRHSRAISEVLTDGIKSRAASAYIISIEILACEGVRAPGQAGVKFEADWQLLGPEGVLQQGRFRLPPTAWNGQNYGELAHGLSQGVTELSKVLLEALAPIVAKTASH